jgi:hypothetical protein
LVNNPSMDNLAGIVLIAFYESQMQRKDCESVPELVQPYADTF